MTTIPPERVDLEVTEADSDRPPILHAFCDNCINTLPKIVSMCGFKYHEASDFSGPDPEDGELCVVCDELAWGPCQVCGH